MYLYACPCASANSLLCFHINDLHIKYYEMIDFSLIIFNFGITIITVGNGQTKKLSCCEHL